MDFVDFVFRQTSLRTLMWCDPVCDDVLTVF